VASSPRQDSGAEPSVDAGNESVPYHVLVQRSVERGMRWLTVLIWVGVALTVRGRSGPNIAQKVTSALALTYLWLVVIPAARQGKSRPIHSWIFSVIVACDIAATVWWWRDDS
jgi:hypothetical protein